MPVALASFDHRTVANLLLDLWDWWVTELKDTVPSAWRRQFHRMQPGLLIGFDSEGATIRRRRFRGERFVARIPIDQIEAPHPELAPLLARAAAERVEVRLPASLVLKQRLTVPQAPPRRLTQLLRFELDRQTPFRPDQVYFGFKTIEQSTPAGRIIVEVALVKRPAADALLSGIRHWTSVPLPLVLEAEAGWVLDRGDETMTWRSAWPRYRLAVALAALAIGLGVSAEFVHQQADAASDRALAFALATAKRDAEAAKAVDREAQLLADRLGFLATRRGGTDVAQILEDLAERLPDDSWVTQLEASGRTIVLHGQSRRAAALIGLLSDSPLLANPHFSAATTQTQSGSEHFDLSVDFRERPRP
jgi:general secretion pathway protein L